MRRFRSAGVAVALVGSCLLAGCADLGLDISGLERGTVNQVLLGNHAFCMIIMIAVTSTHSLAEFQCDPDPEAFRARKRIAATVGGAGTAGTSSLLETLAVASSTKAKKIPTWTAVLPAELPARRATGASAIVAAFDAVDGDGETATTLPRKLQASVYTVDGKGKRKRIARRNAKIDRNRGTATLVFESLKAPASHYEVDLKLKGGSVQSGDLRFSAAVRYDEDVARRPRGSRRSAVRSARSRWTASGSGVDGITSSGVLALASVAVDGEVNGNQLPTRSVSLYSPAAALRAASRTGAQTVSGLVIVGNEEFGETPAKLPTRVTFTLYDIDADGTRTKLATESATIVKDNGLGVAELGIFPAASDHYELVGEAVGGSIRDASLFIGGVMADEDSARRLRTLRHRLGASKMLRSPPPVTGREATVAGIR